MGSQDYSPWGREELDDWVTNTGSKKIYKYELSLHLSTIHSENYAEGKKETEVQV